MIKNLSQSNDALQSIQNSSQNEIILYRPNDTISLEVRLENETVWLSIDMMSELFQRDKSTISRHIKNIFAEGELMPISVVANFATTASDGKIYRVDFYNLDVVISVGYRVKSIRGTQFRQWANKVLKEYLLSGYSINSRVLELENIYTKAHDRFLIVDDKVYHVGASVKDLGKKLCAVSLLSCIDADEMIGKL